MRNWIAIALALLLAACGKVEQKPNLLVIILDTTRADHLGCYGAPAPNTPVIDGLAAEGVRFDQAYSQSSLTPVSASTLLSGALPFRHGVRSLFAIVGQTLSADVASLPEMLATSGRRTAAFVSAKPMGSQYGLDRGFATFDDDLEPTRRRYAIEKPSDAPQRPGEETADLALAWLDQHAGEPFALLVHFFDAHDPTFVPPIDWLAKQVAFPLPQGLARYGLPTRIPALSDALARVALYDAEIRWTDQQVARLIEKLRASGRLDDTLVAIVADHGQGLGQHDFWAHGLLYQEQLRVPWILRGPGVPRGKVVAERVRLVDFLPTIADLLDLTMPSAKLDGESVVPAIEGRASAHEQRSVYAEVQHSPDDRYGRDQVMHTIRVHDWKLIHKPESGAHELYDLAKDPEERTNLYAPDHPMARALEFRLAQMGALGSAPPPLDGLSDDVRAALENLGYL
jgi:arylsulfatase A-like enzyme